VIQTSSPLCQVVSLATKPLLVVSMTPAPSVFIAGLGDGYAINNTKSDNASIDNDDDDSETVVFVNLSFTEMKRSQYLCVVGNKGSQLKFQVMWSWTPT
jgi:hypothetical protein